MPRSSHRPEQVAEIIRQVVSEALMHEVRDPRIGRVTITGVTATGDLSRARIRYVVAEDPEGEAQRRAADGLASASGFLRGRVARSLATRIVPELVFELDRGAEHAARMEALLASLRGGDREEEGEGEGDPA